jgi:hypothetical protein
MSDFTFLVVYLSPTLIGWYRARQGKATVLPLKQLFLFNLFLGWTVVGWVLALANALGFNPIAPLAQRLAKGLSAGGAPGMGPAGSDGSGSSSTLGRTCPTCNGQGRMTCAACNGSGQRYEGAGLVTCSLCQGQRTVQCRCGGSGRVYG